MKLIYISTVDSAFNSQVVELVTFLSTHNINVYLVLITDKFVSLEIKNIKIYSYKNIPDYPGAEFYHQVKLKKIFRKIGLDSNTIIHTRGHLSAYFALSTIKKYKFPHVEVLTDFRAAIIEEIEIYYKLHPVLKKLKKHLFETAFLGVAKSSAFSAVSNTLKEYILSKGNFTQRIFINTCISGRNFTYKDDIRVTYRKKLNLKDNETLLVFSTGGNAGWQQTDVVIQLAEKLNIKILMLGASGESNERIIKLKVPYQEVSNYLNAADIGLLFRNEDIVNKVAAPIKFSEYLSCGLPVIANDTITSVVEVIKESGYGKIVDNINSIDFNMINQLIKQNRFEISRYALNTFGIDSIGKSYISCYSQILNYKL